MADILIKQDMNLGGISIIKNLGAPVNDNDAVRKIDLDKAVEGLSWKDSAVVATASNITLSAPGVLVDGETLNVGDRVLVLNQTNAYENGIYIYNGSATPMARSLDANSADDLINATLMVEKGTYIGVTFRQNAVINTLGTDDITFILFGNAAAPASETVAGIIEIATLAEVNAGIASDLVVTPSTLAGSTYVVKRYTQVFGDGSNTQFTIVHNFGNKFPMISIVKDSTGDKIECGITYDSINQLSLHFKVAPTTNELRVNVIG